MGCRKPLTVDHVSILIVTNLGNLTSSISASFLFVADVTISGHITEKERVIPVHLDPGEDL